MTEKLTRDMVEAARGIAERDRRLLDRSAEQHATSWRPITRWPRRSGAQTDGRIDGFVQSVGHGRLAARDRGRPAPPPEPDPNRRGGAGGVPGSVGRPVRRSQDRRHRGRIRRAALAGRHRRSDRAGVHGRRAWRWPSASPARKACFAGTSTGANVIAALRVAEQLGPGSDRRHHHVRYRHEVSPDVRREARLSRLQLGAPDPQDRLPHPESEPRVETPRRERHHEPVPARDVVGGGQASPQEEPVPGRGQQPDAVEVPEGEPSKARRDDPLERPARVAAMVADRAVEGASRATRGRARAR